MSDVQQVIGIVANPNPDDPTDTGRVTLGYYVMDGDLLTMTDGDGRPFRGRNGEVVTHTMQPGDDPTMVAKRLTLRIYRTVRGDDRADFHRKMVYLPSGVV